MSLINNKYFVSLLKKIFMRNVAILTGGDSAEYEISISSANTVLKNLNSNLFIGYIIHLKDGKFTAHVEEEEIKVNKNNFTFILNNQLISFNIVFMALHGPPAENGVIQPYFDNLNISYSSCSESVSALTFNKYECNKQLDKLGFNCAKSLKHILGNTINKEEIVAKIGFPCFIKPNSSGSSYGISKVKKTDNLINAVRHALKYDNQVIIEQFIKGTEVSVGVYKKLYEIKTLPITEIISENDFFDYDAKYNGKSEEITPARINRKLSEDIIKITKAIYEEMSLSGICRIDYIIQDGIPFIIEINTIPGLSKESIIPKQLKTANISLSEIFELCLSNIN